MAGEQQRHSRCRGERWTGAGCGRRRDRADRGLGAGVRARARRQRSRLPRQERRRAGTTGPPPTRRAVAEIPPERLALYRAAGRLDRDRLDLPRLDRRAGVRPRVVPLATTATGCAGPMQISMRRGSPCSPSASEPTEWERWAIDGDGDGTKDVNDPADAIFTAARCCASARARRAAGGSYRRLPRRLVPLLRRMLVTASPTTPTTVMRRAVCYGFRGRGAPAVTDPDDGRHRRPRRRVHARWMAPPIGGGRSRPGRAAAGRRGGWRRCRRR